MTRLSITIDSGKFEKFLKDSPLKLQQAIQNVIYKASLLVERGAKIKAPVDTGRLRSSISTDIQPMSATIQPNVNYAIYVHEGTRFITGRPFMNDTAVEVEKLIPGLVQDELKKIS